MTEEQEYSIHPIDVDTLEKGDIISIERIQEITSTKFGTDKYNLGMMALIEFIHRESGLNGTNLHCKREKGALKVLLDNEDIHHQQQSSRSGLRRFFRSMKRQTEIDESNLTQEEKKLHRDRLGKNAFVASSIKKARHSFLQEKKDPLIE